MKRFVLFIPLTVLIVWASVSQGSPLSPVPPQTPPEIAGLKSYVMSQEFKGGERACVIATGNDKSNVGLYVYDSQGNCVAWDDVVGQRVATYDAAAVEWHPAQNGIYVIEVHNNGTRANQFKVFVR